MSAVTHHSLLPILKIGGDYRNKQNDKAFVLGFSLESRKYIF